MRRRRASRSRCCWASWCAPAAIAATALTANIWLGLYHKGSEWPWQYMFLTLVLAFLAAAAGGRGFGLDAMIRRSPPTWMRRHGFITRVYRAIS